MKQQEDLRAAPAAMSVFLRLTWLPVATFCAVSESAFGVTLQKAFNPTTILDGQTTELVFTVTNAAGSPSHSDLGIVDTLPSGLRIALSPQVSGTCVNAAAATFASGGGSTISIFNLQISGDAGFDVTCTVTVRVTNVPGQFNSSCAAQPSAFTNGAANVSVTNLTNAVSPSCVDVIDIFADGFD